MLIFAGIKTSNPCTPQQTYNHVVLIQKGGATHAVAEKSNHSFSEVLNNTSEQVAPSLSWQEEL